MGANTQAGAEHKFKFYDSQAGTVLGRTGASWRKYFLVEIGKMNEL